MCAALNAPEPPGVSAFKRGAALDAAGAAGSSRVTPQRGRSVFRTLTEFQL